MIECTTHDGLSSSKFFCNHLVSSCRDQEAIATHDESKIPDLFLVSCRPALCRSERIGLKECPDSTAAFLKASLMSYCPMFRMRTFAWCQRELLADQPLQEFNIVLTHCMLSCYQQGHPVRFQVPSLDKPLSNFELSVAANLLKDKEVSVCQPCAWDVQVVGQSLC